MQALQDFDPYDNVQSQSGRSLAIIGGGLSGLTSALHWLRLNPENTCTIYEMKGNVGGWTYTHKNEEVSRPFETGARVIKNDQMAKDFYMMCH